MKIVKALVAICILMSSIFYQVISYAERGNQITASSCIQATSIMPPSGSWYWDVKLNIKNTCQHEVDMRNAQLSVETPFLPSELRVDFNNSGMSWANVTVINQAREAQNNDYPSLSNYKNTFMLDYSSDTWIKTKLKAGGELIVTLAASLKEPMVFSENMASLMKDSFKCISATEPPPPAVTGKINISLTAAPESNSNFPTSVDVTLTGPSGYQKKLNLDWGSNVIVQNLQQGDYQISSQNIYFNGLMYFAELPHSISINENNLEVSASLSFRKKIEGLGSIIIKLNGAPSIGMPPPIITLHDVSANTNQQLTIDWGAIYRVDNLLVNHQYQVEATAIDGYTRTVQPSTFMLNIDTPLEVDVQYLNSVPPPSMSQVNLSILGLPEEELGLISFININTQQKHDFSFVSGTHLISLPQGVYNVSAASNGQYIPNLMSGSNPISLVSEEVNTLIYEYKKTTLSNRRIVAYFTAWGIYGRNYQVTDIPALKITDINYAFININNGECVLGDPWADIDKRYPAATTSLGVFPEDSWVNPKTEYFGNFNRLNIMKNLAKQKGHQINLFLSVGGWTWSKYFSDVAANSQSREKFVDSCINLMNKYKFDGIDLDWEYPVSGGLAGNHNRPEDKQNYTLLLKRFREKLAPGKLLTIAAPAGPNKIPNIEWDKISSYVDWVNLMAYDFHGGWDSITGHHAALYPNPSDPSPLTLNADSAINHIQRLGFPLNKLTLGVGFYGRGWQSVGSYNNGLFQPGVKSSLGTWESGVFDYHDLVNNYIPSYQSLFDNAARVPYLYSTATQTFISYENPESMQIKAQYILNRGLAGVMFWELSGDIRNSNSNDSLLGTLYRRLLSTK